VCFGTSRSTVALRKLVAAAAGLRHSRAPAIHLSRLLFSGGGVWFASHFMKAIQGYHLIKPEDLFWRPSNLMRIPNADYLERTGSENMGARLWRLPPKSANTLHKHIRQEEFYFVLEGTGRIRVGDNTLTVPRYGGVLVGPDQLRQVFNDTAAEVLWLIIGAPEELEFLQGSKSQMDLSLIYPVDPTQLPKELAGVEWPPKS
jgi:mannose-6-phosphate isomerase-like protein (cupin superfamily)